MLSTLMQDLRYAIRWMIRSPGFTLVSVITLALGIGGNTAVFSLVNAVLLRPLPYHDVDRLVMLRETHPGDGETFRPVSPANYADWRDRSASYEQIGISSDAMFALTG